MKKLKKKGYILITTLIMISASMAILISVLQKTSNFQKQVSFNFKKEKLRLLTLSSIEIALSQISFKQENDKKENSNKEWFKKLTKVVNKWQNIEIKESDISANIKLYITCQEGKLDLNYIQKQVEDQDKNKDKNQEDNKEDKKNFLSSINKLIEKNLNINIISSVKELDSIISRDIESPLDFLKLNSFSKIKENIFTSLDNNNIYLTDLFSCDFEEQNKLLVFSTLFGQKNSSNKITPWLLSKSFCKLLELGTQVNLEEVASKFKDNANWNSDWDNIFTPIYGKSFSSIDKEISSLFSSNFNPKSFSVVIYVTLDNITQRLFAILKRDSTEKDQKNIIFRIDKIYWF